MREADKMTDLQMELDVTLTAQEQKTVEDFSQRIDLGDSTVVLQYGAVCQNRFARFSDQVLESMGDDKLDEACAGITELAAQLREFSVEPEEKGFLGLFSPKEERFDRWKARYDKALIQVEQLAGILEGCQNRLLTDLVMLDRLYDTNLTYYKELSMYILAGQRKLARERSTTLAALQETARTTLAVSDAQAAKDCSDLCDRFERRLSDLALTRTVSLQLAAQLRLLQSNHTVVQEKLQATLKSTIPLWKNQMLLALGLNRSQQALEVQEDAATLAVDSMHRSTGALKNAAARLEAQTEKGSVDVDKLQSANEALMETLDEVLRVQSQERQKRLDAENEMVKIECQMKQQLS